MPGTRERLVDEATTLLDHGGVDAVTLREVGHRAGVSHNAPYKHFANKEALLAAIAARELHHLAEMQTNAATQDGCTAPLRAVLHGYVDWALAHPARFKLVFSRWTTDSEELAVSARASWERLVGVVTSAQRDGALPDGAPDRLTSLLRSLTHGAVDLALSGHLGINGKGGADATALVDDLLAHLRAAAAAPGSPHEAASGPAIRSR